MSYTCRSSGHLARHLLGRSLLYRSTSAGVRCLGTSEKRDGEPSTEPQEEAIPFRPSTAQAPTMMDIGTRSIFNEDHDIFRKSVRKFFNEEVLPYHAQWEKDGQISRECWLKAGENGLLGTDTPAELGGIGGDFKDASVIMEEQSYVNCSGPGFPLHSHIVMPYIFRYGTQEQIEKYIPDMVAGHKIGAIAMTEPGAGRLFLSQDTAELFFEDVRLPSSALLGKVNHGFYYLMNELPQERILIGIMSCANCEWQFEETRGYLRSRKAFGKTLSSLQTIQHKLAELKTEICVGRAFTDQCIDLHNAGKLDGGMASMNKYWMSDLQNRVGYQCVQLHGGWGYMWEYPICKSYVDAKVQTIYGGSNEIMKELIARQIVGDKRV
ncbi:long-chain specific acyl-CoA dehydrogenase, mitochondrial-like [Panulirus ornatus]|uniref:long-chain specific acyl-CoA dehydrogenase, mitochondrial-like n=1 Tax=Panulirus ornatus TaxID=150431 RepID=UPI003A87FFD8